MRGSLHFHMLLTLLGSQRPDEVRAKLLADFESQVRKMWLWIASIHFNAPEAFAHACGEPAAMTALHSAPLIPIKPHQQEMLGLERSRQCAVAQMQARGLSELPTKTDIVTTIPTLGSRTCTETRA